MLRRWPPLGRVDGGSWCLDTDTVDYDSKRVEVGSWVEEIMTDDGRVEMSLSDFFSGGESSKTPKMELIP